MTANYQAYFIDLDGTTYKGKKRIPAAARFIKRLQSAGKQVLFVTNNSTRSPQFVADNLDQVAGERRSVYVVGESGLREVLAAKGFKDDDQDPDFVVVGLDSHVTYEKLEKAVLLIRAGAKFIGTNADSNLPNERGMVPGAGSLVKLVEYATQQKPLMIGKPEKIIMEMALKRVGLTTADAVMVGG